MPTFAAALRSVLLIVSCLLFTTSISAASSTDVQSCFECHGNNGVSQKSDVPTIAGMSDFYLEGQMQAYQKGQRPCPTMKDKTMCDIAKKLNAAQVTEISKYFAAQKFVAAKQPVDAALAAKGKSIHDKHCEICHSDGGSQAADDAGILAGQWKPVFVTTMNDYRQGQRIEPTGMKVQTSKLTTEDIKALAEFYASEGAK